MNSQNHYQLNFNPRTNRPNRAQKQTRYVTQYRNIASIAPNWRQNVPIQPVSQQLQNPPNRHIPSQQREYIVGLSANNNGYASNSSRLASSRRDEQIRNRQQQRKKQDIMKRVRELQDKVLPMVERDEKQQDGLETGWQSRVQVKIMRLERGMDNIRKQWQIEMERKLIELEAQWQNNFQHFVENHSH